MASLENQLIAWEKRYLLASGHYAGPDLTDKGFPYRPGQHVPIDIDKRYSAMLAHRRARRALSMTV
jgi:hypothetical protein